MPQSAFVIYACFSPKDPRRPLPIYSQQVAQRLLLDLLESGNYSRLLLTSSCPKEPSYPVILSLTYHLKRQKNRAIRAPTNADIYSFADYLARKQAMASLAHAFANNPYGF
jgi:hypothetical protein